MIEKTNVKPFQDGANKAPCDCFVTRINKIALGSIHAFNYHGMHYIVESIRNKPFIKHLSYDFNMHAFGVQTFECIHLKT